jgi:hypothetical protein
LALAGRGIGEIAKRPIEGLDAVAHTGVHHLGDGVVPQILLEETACAGPSVAVREHTVAGMPAAHARRFHAAGGGKIRRPKAHAMHARARCRNLLDVGHPFCGFQDGVEENGLAEAVARFELRQELVEVMDVPGPLHLGQHDDVEPVADRGYDLDHVVESPRRVQAVDARPKPSLAEDIVAGEPDEPAPCRFLLVRRNGVLEVAEDDIDLPNELWELRPDLVVVRRYEVDHALETHRKLPIRLRGADGEWGEELDRGAGGGHCAVVRLGVAALQQDLSGCTSHVNLRLAVPSMRRLVSRCDLRVNSSGDCPTSIAPAPRESRPRTVSACPP